MKSRHSLLIYVALSRRISRPALILFLLLLGLFLADLYIFTFLEQWRLAVIALMLGLFVIWAYAIIWLRQSTVRVRESHLLIQGPFSSFKIPYEQVIAIVPTRMSQEFPTDQINDRELGWLDELYNAPCALIETRGNPLADKAKRRLFSRFLFPPQRRGLLLIVDDWVSLSQTLEAARSAWKSKQAPRVQSDIAVENLREMMAASQGEQNDNLPLIMFVDDSPAHHNHLQRILGGRYRLVFARNGVRGLRVAREAYPDLILADVHLPKMAGLEMLQAIRRSKRIGRTPVVFVTDEVDARDHANLLQAGANDYLVRPLTDAELVSRIEMWLRIRLRELSLEEQIDQLQSQTLNQMSELVRRGELINFLPDTVAESIMSGVIDSRQRPFKRQKVTVLFIDIVGFTDLTARLDPKILSELLNEYLREMTAVAIANNGTVDKFIGDAVMVLYGAPNEYEEALQARHAIDTALQMRDRVQEINMIWTQYLPRDLSVRIGVNTGFCTAGVFGNDLLRSYTVVGSAVNIAARLQSAASPGQIVCSAETFDWVKDRVVVRPMGDLMLKGVSHTVTGYEVLELIKK